jgi:hypothetical protein
LQKRFPKLALGFIPVMGGKKIKISFAGRILAKGNVKRDFWAIGRKNN